MSLSGITTSDWSSISWPQRRGQDASAAASSTAAAQTSSQATASGTDEPSASSSVPQLKADLSALASAIQSGGITAGAPSSVEQNWQTTFGGDATAPSTFADDLASLLQAVQSGNVADLQAAAAVVQKNLQDALGSNQSTGTAVHRHPDHHLGDNSSTPTTTDSASSTDTGLAAPIAFTSTTPSVPTTSTSGSANNDYLLASALASYASNS